MLNALQKYPKHSVTLVRDTFCDEAAVDEAVACYVRGQPGENDLRALRETQPLLRHSEDNPLAFFAAKLHIRTMRILNIDVYNRNFLKAWFITASAVIEAPRGLFAKLYPDS